jgi:mono/diheme cytochrome c family protein
MHRSRTKGIVLALSLIFILILVACSDTQSTPGGDTAQPQATEFVEDEHVEEEGDDYDDAETDHDDEGEDDHDDADTDHDDSEADHDEDDHAHVEAPHEYEDLVNPVDGDSAAVAAAVAAGEALFLASCATCHGETGMGDGDAAAGLDPKPASLADAEMLAELSDGYLYWRIELGGAMEPFNSAMPAWGEAYSEDQIWQLVTFIRSLPGE